jgi:MFS family permease
MQPPETDVVAQRGQAKATALKFVLLIGVMSFFADFTYEGSRSITGPYLAVLGASAAVVGISAGFGELLGYALRLVSGRLSDRTGEYWPITLIRYFVQMSSVPLLALTGTWHFAVGLIITERIGRAIRNPPRDVMLSHAAREMGYGWGFGVHEALDQFGALFGPLAIALVLALRGGLETRFADKVDYHFVYALLLVPAVTCLSLLLAARFLYPRPQDLEAHPPDLKARGLPRAFWVYLAGAALVAAGSADFALMAYHFEKVSTVPDVWVPIFYAAAMGVSGIGSLVFGRLFDRAGISILVPPTIVSALAAPLVFLGGFWAALAGSALWGLGMGVHESIMPAAVAPMAPPQRRASAYGLFTACYGVSWFLGSALMGLLYDVSLPTLISFSIAAQFAATPLLLAAAKSGSTSS